MPQSNLARVIDPAETRAAPAGRKPPRPETDTRPATGRLAPRVRSSASTRRITLAVIVGFLLAINIGGAPYYLLPIAARVRHPLHLWLRPSGYVGQSAGIVALAIFAFLWLYPLRKRLKSLTFLGSVGRWLDVHVTVALAMPLLLAIHAAWRFDGVIGLGYDAILLVCASGVIGRYLYTRIPRTRSGVELSLEQVSAQRRALILEIAATTGLASEVVERTLGDDASRRSGGSALRILLDLLTNDLRRWRRTRELRRRWRQVTGGRRQLDGRALNDVVRLADREIALEQQSRMLAATHRVFRYWHVAHRPVAITALLAVIIHVTIVVALGATWLR
jgi:hypothetical protein